MQEKSNDSFISDEIRKKIEYIIEIEKRHDKLVSIVPSEGELEDDPIGIDDAFVEFGVTWIEVLISLTQLLVSKDEISEIVRKSFQKILKVEMNCREKVILYLNFAIEEVIEEKITSVELKKNFLNIQKSYELRNEKFDGKITEAYISDLDVCVQEHYECYDQFKTLKIVTKEKDKKERRNIYLTVILTVILTAVATTFVTQILSL